ncbi:hypothetical protein OTK49_20990 [Vibrio coralliirubri]|uniref:hypothetical protein n=1 Tax=Vibrio coralliirubri TaxID=1516159 RepID=UPI002283B529|nr:hypothetical protein [Vibrio coralliirubri]MCY9864996.1 hypothetical protein [Vibrio coralliirubri]
MSNKEFAKAIISDIYDEYRDEFQEVVFGRPIKELITESLLERFEETKEMPNELDIWVQYEDIAIGYREDLMMANAEVIKRGELGIEFANQKGTQFGVMVACQSGSAYKVALFDERAIFSHYSSDDPVDIARYLREYSINETNKDLKFEKFCENDIFINNTARLMDGNKSKMFSPKI